VRIVPADLSPTAVVSARGLSKSFGHRDVLHDVSFDIPPGRVYGLIGHNGAGKSTTINAILGLTSCKGAIRVLGLDPYRHRPRLMRDVAFIADVASLPRFLLVRQVLDLVAGIHPHFSRAEAVRFLEGTDVRPYAKIGALSKGMLAQLHLAIVMAIDARLLVLDEPTLGLDITFRKRFYRRLADDYMRPDRSVLITTHQVDEIEQFLTDIMFMREGRVVLDASMTAVGERYVQLIVSPAAEAEAAELTPLYEERRFGQHVMIFESGNREHLATLGTISTPQLSDLFVALMEPPAPREPERIR
jgi:ABC-2 type transport system ATP-binding protein